MRIGVDARELCGRATGVGRYLAGLLAEWGGSDETRRHEFVLYAPHAIAPALDARRFATRTIAGSGGTRWEQIDLPRAIARDPLDVWFAPAYSAPLLTRVPTVVAIHDLSFVAHPEWFTWREGAKRRLLVGRSARTARAVVTISEFTRGELIERLGIPRDTIHVIPPGIHSSEPATQNSEPRTGTPRVLYVGSIFNRRHVPDLIRGFAPIARAHADAALDIVGDDRTFPRENIASVIASLGLGARVTCHRYAAEPQLRALYASARAFAFLSEYEGLGLTPLEALAAGVPPVLLDTPVARESCGAAAIYVPAPEIGAITRALGRALFSDDDRRAVLAAAPATLARYQWARAGRETLALLEACAG